MTQPDKLSVEVVKESRGELLSEGFAIDSVAIMVHDQLADTMREKERLRDALRGLVKHFDMANGVVTSIVSKETVKKAREELQKE